MTPRTDFPPVRACLFDMDGLLLDTEDLYTLCINLILEKYGRPKMPWSIKAKLQGRPGPAATRLFHDWAQLPIDYPTYISEYYALQARHFPGTQPMPGIPELLSDLGRTRVYDGVVPSSAATQLAGHAPPAHRVHIALATSAHEANFKLKTSHLSELFSVFENHRRVLGDDARIPPGRGKPLPDIYLIALNTINESLPATEPPIRPEECLVFEDSVPGVEAGRRAGFRVVWCPHPLIKKHYAGREAEVLAGRTGEAGDVDMHQVGELDDGWAEYMPTLVGFPFEKYGIRIPDKAEVEKGAVKMGEAVHVGNPRKDGAVVGEEEIIELVKPGPKATLVA